jgi:hypothetical protein
MEDFRGLTELLQGQAILGLDVEEPAAIPATGPLFVISNGRVLVTSIIGEITVGMDGNATSIKLQAVPSVGTTTDLCSVLNVASYALGDELGITGTPADAMLPATTGSSVPGQKTPVMVKPGTINLNLAAPGQLLGKIRWTLHYATLDYGATVTAH